MNYFSYFSEIEETFIRRRGRNLLLSPLDWALIEAWQERGIPLRIILRSIDKVFDGVDQQPAKSKRTVKSLMYCREEIEAQYAEWLENQVGRNGAGEEQVQSSKLKARSPKPEAQSSESATAARNELFPAEVISSHLEKVAGELNSAANKAKGDLRGDLQKVVESLTKLERNRDTEKLEDALEKLDAFVDAALLKSFETGELKAEIEKQLAAHRNKMEREAYDRTIVLMLLKTLREKAEIPRLSLFYL